MRLNEDAEICPACGEGFVKTTAAQHRDGERCRAADELREHGWSIRPDGAWTLMVRGVRSGSTPRGVPIFYVGRS